VKYLFGDSTDAALEFDYLAFLRDVVDCAVVMVECGLSLSAAAERRKTRERETEVQLVAVAELGNRVAEFVAAQPQTGAVARVAAAITKAIDDAVELETSQSRAKLVGELEEIAREGQTVHARTKAALDTLLRTHDLPAAEKELHVEIGTGVKASLRERTTFGVDIVMALDVTAGSLLVPDLRVERVADGVEVHLRETGGWLKKGEKLVVHKLGRYHVASITIGEHIRIALRAEGAGAGLQITAHPNGELAVESPGRDVVIDERDRHGLRTFVDRLEGATRALTGSRAGLGSVEVDGKSLADLGNPRVIAERLVAAIAPTVQKIKVHSRSPGELVIRRLIADNRREEVFVSISEIVEKFERLPVAARSVFAPLQLDESIRSTREGTKPDTRPPANEPKPAEPKPALAATLVEPVAAKTAEPKLGDSKLVDTKPVEPKPALAATLAEQPKLVEAKPAQTTPGESKPAAEPAAIEAKRADSDSPFASDSKLATPAELRASLENRTPQDKPAPASVTHRTLPPPPPGANALEAKLAHMAANALDVPVGDSKLTDEMRSRSARISSQPMISPMVSRTPTGQHGAPLGERPRTPTGPQGVPVERSRMPTGPQGERARTPTGPLGSKTTTQPFGVPTGETRRPSKTPSTPPPPPSGVPTPRDADEDSWPVIAKDDGDEVTQIETKPTGVFAPSRDDASKEPS
jgi:hypothetical protein